MSDVIRLLPDAIANQIAAGEVVQRPASVVKELMENSIDAGASKVQVLVKEAGKLLIQVVDNGKGMSETDARMSFERHATSKITAAEDLFAIKTMGFRGEALASIAAVAQVELKTRPHTSELGTRICIEGSEVEKQEPVVCPAGTSIAVKNLFFNIPARRNFLKSNPVEMRHILEEFQRVALAHPEVAFTFHQNDLETFNLTPGKLSHRIVQLFNKNYQQQMAACKEETPHVKLFGYIGQPQAAKRTRGEQYFFVNNRFIKSAYLNHAVLGAYEGLLQAETYPFYVLFLEIDPGDIDINVHPTKTEIKFTDERTVYAVVQAAVRQALGAHNLTPSLDFDQDVNFSALVNAMPGKALSATSSFSNFSVPQPMVGSGSTSGVGSNRQYESAYSNQQFKKQPVQGWEGLFEGMKNEPQVASQSSATSLTIASSLNQQEGQLDAALLTENRQVVFQLHSRYILSSVKSGLMIVDQQAAHERVLYEKFTQQLQYGAGHAQQTLFPQQVQLPKTDFALLQDYLNEIKQLGFELEPFSGDSIIIKGTPADLSHIDGQQLLEGLLEQLKHATSSLNLPKRERTAYALAVRAAIKPGQVLSEEEGRSLIDQLFACQKPAYAPNGRATFKMLDLAQLAQLFS